VVSERTKPEKGHLRGRCTEGEMKKGSLIEKIRESEIERDRG